MSAFTPDLLPMSTHRHLLALRLESLPEDELHRLYGRLLHVTTGAEPGESANMDRSLHLFETTDCERGALLRRLLGVETGGCEPWRVDSKQLHLQQTILFRSVTGQPGTNYFSESGVVIPLDQAERLLTETAGHESEPLIVSRDFPKLPEGWTLVAAPPISPISVATSHAPLLWVLICRNPVSAESILEELGRSRPGVRPLLVVFDECGPTIPEHVGDVRSCSIEEAPDLLAQFFARSELLLHPDKRQLIRAIMVLHASASTLISGQANEARSNESLGLTLERARLEWEMMFIDERREGLRDLRLNVIAHPLQKTRLILTSEREAQVSHYLRTQLAPRIQNFVKRQALELTRVRLDHAALAQQTNLAVPNPDSTHLRAGIMMALPSLALLIPSISIEPSRIVQALNESGTDEVAALDSGDAPGVPDTPDLGDGWLDGLASTVAAKVAPLLEKGKDWLGDVLSQPFDGIERHLGSIDSRLGQLLGILVAGQIAVAVAAVIGSVIMIKGSLSLTQTEEMLGKLLDDLEAEWPRIRESLEALVPELEGRSSDLLVTRARHLLAELNSI